MANDTAQADDETNIEVQPSEPADNRSEYRVLSEAGLYKNSAYYPEGSTVMLEPGAAKNFMAIGDVEPV